jgi:hypothetical protein
MRNVKFVDQELQMRATPLALLFYRQEFGRDLIADLSALRNWKTMASGDMSSFDSVLLLKVGYVMNRAANPAKALIFPKFEEWLGNLNIDFSEPEWMVALVEEAVDGFFPSRKNHPAARAKKAKSEQK